MSSSRPIEIIGGGLAGLSLGAALARSGATVAVYELGNYPRHRVCGEFITGLNRAAIDRLGLAPVFATALPHSHVTWFHRGVRSGRQRLPAPALALSRHVLDAKLAEAFVAAGGELRTGERVLETRGAPGRVFATGRRLGKPEWLGLKFHVRGVALEDGLELHLGDHGYAGLTRVDAATVNVCGLFRQRAVHGRGPELLLGYLRASGLAALATRLADGIIDASSCCAVAALGFDRRVRGFHEAGRIELGDTAAMIPPFTGHGMAMAFQSADCAFGPLLAYARGESDWPATCRATQARLRGQFRTRLISAHVLHPFLLRPARQRWLAALSRSRLLPFRTLYEALH
jgi:flavin-dependent dehydrogenase